jgi:beta-glucanase (GH16 family)
MKWHATTGFWGAFWMMCGHVGKVDGSAVSGAEIDIVESGERARNGVNHAIHWDGYGDAHKSVTKVIPDCGLYDGEWHTYALRWTKDEYIFYIDGKETWRTSEPGICNQPGYLKLTTEFGSWAKPIVPEELPDCVRVDWVRVYEEA